MIKKTKKQIYCKGECFFIVYCKDKNKNTSIQKHKLKYTNTKTQIKIHKYKYTNTNIQIQIYKYKYKNTNT